VIEALASISSVSTLALVGVVVWLVYKSFAAKDGELAASKAFEKERDEHRATRGELQVEEAAHTATRDLLKKEQDLRAEAEAQRNDAERRVRDEIVEHILASDIDGAVALGNRILSAPLPGVRLSETPDGALEKP
jgi:hypothetical protein